MQTAHRHQPEAQGSVHQWCSLLWTGPHLLRITLHIHPLTISRTIQPPHPFHHQEPPRMELSTWNRLTAHGLLHPLRLLFTYNPLKHLSIITYCVCSVPVYTLDIKAIQLNVSILILNINRYRYLASTFPTSPTALPCSTSLYQVSPTMPCILLVTV